MNNTWFRSETAMQLSSGHIALVVGVLLLAYATGCDSAGGGSLDESDAGMTGNGNGSDAAGGGDDVRIGPRPVASTPLADGTIFAAPNGSGETCSEQSPCSLSTAVGAARKGDVVFLRGGVYDVTYDVRVSSSGTKDEPIIVESYPNELAILDGSSSSTSQNIIGIRISGDFVFVRKIEVRNFPKQGIYISGNDNLIEGVVSHHNKLTGIHIYSPYDDFPYGNQGSRNTIRDSIVHDNSGAGLGGAEYDDGGNSDGISISSGADNRVEHTLAYRNSDDGMDTWRSTGSYIGYSIAWGNGIANGNGQGFKAGGAAPSEGTVVEHSIAYDNDSAGFDYNSGKKVIFRHVTSFNNARAFTLGNDTVVTKSIAALDGTNISGTGMATDNSWQRDGTPELMSIDPESPDFAVPVPGGGFEDIGAFAGL